MAKKRFDTEEEALGAAKTYLERDYDRGVICKRDWYEASPKDSYQDPSYNVRVLVREGSPPKAIIVIDRAVCRLRGYDCHLEQKIFYVWGPY